MESVASNSSLPMLVADLADEGSRDFLLGVALAEQVAYVPLLAAPVDRSTHALEVYSPASPEPLRLLADPIGPPTADGFPLRLRVKQQDSASVIKAERKRPTTLRARHETNHNLSQRHTNDLEGAERSKQPTDMIGRALASGKLQIESLIGGGGVGAVYRATHRELRIPVAVKVLHESYQADPDFGRRFHAEALAASRLDHPNITRVLDFGQEPDGLLYLVMEFLDGIGLRALLDREKRFGTDRIVKLMVQVCAGLAHAHARNIVHKDIKPENLVILQGSDDDGMPIEVVKVCDFGLAQGAVAEETRRFQGTPEYMSPEQCLSEELDARSDVYACGIVLYELATGDVPFTDEDVGRIVYKHLHDPPEPPSQRAVVDPRLEALIMRAVAKDKAYRFATMRDLRSALRDLLDLPTPLTSLSGQHAQAKMPSTSQPAVRAPQSSPNLPAVQPPPAAQPAACATPSTASMKRVEKTAGPGSPGWLIHSNSYDIVTAAGAPQSELATDPIAFMRRLVGTTDPRAFAELVLPLDATIRDLVETFDTETLWRLASTLDVLATEGPEVPGSRAASSKAILRILRDPSTLAPIAQRVLTQGDATGERLLTAAGSFGAHALYSARVRQTDREVRKRFTTALRAIGPAAMPILRGGLERLANRLGTPGAVDVAEDLLVSAPKAYDEALGALVAAYARGTNPTLARAAVAALPALWRERSRPIVLGLLEHPDPGVSGAALLALGELGVTDALTPKRVATVLDRAQHKSIRLAAVHVIAQSRGDARRIGSDLIEARLRAAKQPRTVEEAEVAVGLARGLIALAEDRAEAQTTIDEASKDWPKDLRARLNPEQ